MTQTPEPRVEHPACQCCPHIGMSELDRDELAAEVWEYCPTRGCLWQLCAACTEAKRLEVVA